MSIFKSKQGLHKILQHFWTWILGFKLKNFGKGHAVPLHRCPTFLLRMKFLGKMLELHDHMSQADGHLLPQEHEALLLAVVLLVPILKQLFDTDGIRRDGGILHQLVKKGGLHYINNWHGSMIN